MIRQLHKLSEDKILTANNINKSSLERKNYIHGNRDVLINTKKLFDANNLDSRGELLEAMLENDVGIEKATYIAKKYNAFVLQSGNTATIFLYEYNDGNWMKNRIQDKNYYSYAFLYIDGKIIPKSKISKM